MVSKVLSVLVVAGCLLVANANPRVLLQQQPTGMETTMQQPGMQQEIGTQLRVEAPASEQMLSNFDLALTPSQETMSQTDMLMQQLTNPDQFRNWVNERVQRPDGLTAIASVFSNLISRGQSMQLAMALDQAFGQQQQQQQQQQPVAAQTGTSMQQYNPPFTAYTLAIVDQISRQNIQSAGEAIYWALAGAGGEDLARRTVTALDTLQAQIGCSDPLKSALRSAGEVANMEMQGQQGMQGQEGMQGQQGMQASPSNFVTYINQSPPLWACFQNAFPDAQMLMQQGQQGGMTGGQTTGTTGDMAGQP